MAPATPTSAGVATVRNAQNFWGNLQGNVQGFLSEARSVVAENFAGDGEGGGVGGVIGDVRSGVGGVIGDVRRRVGEKLKQPQQAVPGAVPASAKKRELVQKDAAQYFVD